MQLFKSRSKNEIGITETPESKNEKSRNGVSRRDALRVLTAAATTAAFSPLLLGTAEAQKPSYELIGIDKMAPKASATYPYELPLLPYDYSALTAAIDEETMKIHHGKHHLGYTNNLNAALKNHSEFHQKPIIQLLAQSDELPESIRTAVKNNGGGYFNHALFWPMMSPKGGGTPTGQLGEAITRDFGSFEKFKEEFSKAAGTVFGSGWAYLVSDNFAKLSVRKYHNQETPMDSGHKPVLCIDVWEHAYYLRYQNRRSEYIDNFWKVVNWEQANTNYTA